MMRVGVEEARGAKDPWASCNSATCYQDWIGGLGKVYGFQAMRPTGGGGHKGGGVASCCKDWADFVHVEGDSRCDGTRCIATSSNTTCGDGDVGCVRCCPCPCHKRVYWPHNPGWTYWSMPVTYPWLGPTTITSTTTGGYWQ